ncbi:hypothetical protein VHEMI07240 [[Torrubiella] hemipterigena]|uniref:Uncharacterized protein n=1 Tax=[Torrubiella] hemipterigena TaxID=1531966 RepID=A0A0A1TLA0_9HYPO|nr:hypothetical protein VHEMI07240 [[Torrubiella] hemipterigena]
MFAKTALALASTMLFAATGVVAGDAHSNLDWYAPKKVHTQVCGHPGDEHPEDCDQFHTDFKNELHDKIMDSCKTSSCSGEFEHYNYKITIDAIFPPEAKDEFNTQVRNILDKVVAHENQPSLTPGFSFETKFTIPSKMILNRFGDGNEKGHMEITVELEDEDGLCEIFQKIGTAGSVIPEVGGFFGLINLADC